MHNTTQHNTTQHNTTQHNTTQHNTTQHNNKLFGQVTNNFSISPSACIPSSMQAVCFGASCKNVHKFKHFLILFCVCICSLGACSQDADTSEFKELNYDLIFGFRQNSQIRTQLLRAGSNASCAWIPSCSELGSTGLLARSSAIVISHGLKATVEGSTATCRDGSIREVTLVSTGTLTSSSTLTATAHGIVDLAPTSFCTNSVVGASFESSLLQANLQEMQMRLVDRTASMGSREMIELFSDVFVSDFHEAWADGNPTDPNIPDYEGVEDHFRFNVNEENPLLANRLFSMGLESWSHASNRSTRQILRSGWRFTYSYPSDGSSTRNNIYLKYDIAYLHACPIDNHQEIFDNLPSESFELIQPGVFFDYARSTTLTQDMIDNSFEQKSPLYSIYSQYHPVSAANFYSSSPSTEVSNPDTSIVSLISGPRGFLLNGVRNATASQDAFCVSNGSGGYNVLIKNIAEHKIIPTNIDAIQGSSGGNLLMKQKGESGVFDKPFSSVGVLETLSISYDREAHLNAWGLGVPMESYLDPYSPPIDPDFNPDDPTAPPKDPTKYATYFAPITTDIKIATQFERQHPGQPFSPKMEFFESTGTSEEQISSCKKTDPASGQCLEYGGPLESNFLGNPPSETKTLFANPVYGSDGSLEDISVGTTPMKVTGSGSSTSTDSANTTVGYKFTCDNWLFKTDQTQTIGAGPGLAIGFVGSKAYLSSRYPLLTGKDPGPGERILPVLGSFRMICAPWSSVPYIYNWDGLFWTGRKIIRFSDSIISSNDYFIDYLFSGLTSSFSFEKTPGFPFFRARPIAMKTCPPNYVLKGFNVLYNVDPQYVIGVESLICQSTHPRAKDLTVCLNPLNIGKSSCNTSGLDWNGSETFYTMNGDPFSLSQEIGQNMQDDTYPHSSFSIRPIRCINPNEVVNNIHIEGTGNGVITMIHIGCIARPNHLNTSSP